MARKSRNPNFDQIIATLSANSFAVAPFDAIEGGMLVSKHGAGAVLVPAAGEVGAAFAEGPGVLVNGEVARLLDRGYQKFFKSSRFELPASADGLHAIHAFSEEVKMLCGAIDLYNEALGTTSDVHQYDRLQGREPAEPTPVRPWQLPAGH